MIAAHDIYVLEVLRNTLDILKKDAAFNQRMLALYRRHSLDQQLRNLPLFQDLPEAQLDAIRGQVKLLAFQAGQIVCDEHGCTDGMFIVRAGVVQVLRDVSALLRPQDIRACDFVVGEIARA